MHNEFASEEASLEIASTAAVTAIERAQTDIAISTAKRYPRNPANVKAKMLSIATLDEETAAACFYVLPRGGKSIEGPSIRLAEIALSSYQNLKAASRVISVDTTSANPHVVVQAVCHDLENNVAISVEKRRRITGKKSKGGKPDEDDVNLAANACSSIALRDAIFKVVPLALVKPVFHAAKAVAVGNVKSLAVQRTKVVDRLKQMGATEDRILAAIGVAKLEEVDVDKLATLIGLGTALKEGETTLEEAFPPIGQAEPSTKPNFAKPAAPTPAPDPTDPPKEPAPPAPEPQVPPAEVHPSEQLAEIVTKEGYSFDEFQSWALKEGFAPLKTATAFADVPSQLAKRFIGSKAGLLTALAKAKEGGSK
jgi:hypothetical protein